MIEEALSLNIKGSEVPGSVEAFPHLQEGAGVQQKYQKEIEELLARIGEVKPRKRRVRPGGGLFRSLTAPWRGLYYGVRMAASPSDLILTSYVLFFIVFITRALISPVATLLTWIAMLMFLAGYLLFWSNRGGSHERRWRGHSVDPSGQRPDLLDWLRRRKR